MIQKSSLQKFYTELLTILADHGGWKSYKNPAVAFTKAAKAGKLDSISDEEYYAYLNDVEMLSDIWDSEPSMTGWQVLKSTFEDAPVDRDNIPEIAELLTDAYERAHPEYVSDETSFYVDDPFVNLGKGGDMPGGSSGFGGVIHPGLVKNPAACISAGNIYRFLDSHIIKQDEAKKAAASFLRNHIKGHKRNLLFAGPTGCGKTEIFRQIRDNLYGDMIFVDGTHLTQDGWKGDYKLCNIFQQLSKKNAEHAIVVIDEADKMFEPRFSQGENVSFSIQNELLKMIEGDPVEMKTADGTMTIETKGISFAFLGSFERLVQNKGTIKRRGLVFDNVVNEQTEDPDRTYSREFTPEDLVEYAGVRREIAGRIGTIVQLEPMTEDDYFNILSDARLSPIKMLENSYSISIEMDDASKHELARQAAGSRMGVRFLKSRLAKLLDEAMFDDEDKNSYTIRVSES